MTFVVYTDLDGTLLDHQTYSAAAAMPALDKLFQQGIAVIPVTSKTRSELMDLRSQLRLDTPFIVENGAAVFIPRQLHEHTDNPELVVQTRFFIKELSPTAQYWASLTTELSHLIPNAFRSFLQMSVREIAELTGLTTDAAAAARQREYSDPIYWFGNETQYRELQDFCKARDVSVVRGGRFVHLLKGANKGVAVQWLHHYLSAQAAEPLQSIAAGDGENDLSMLAVVDYPIQIKSEQFDFPSFQHPNLTRTNKVGPQGWCDAIEALVWPTHSDTTR